MIKFYSENFLDRNKNASLQQNVSPSKMSLSVILSYAKSVKHLKSNMLGNFQLFLN
jgi:hypothetical protein